MRSRLTDFPAIILLIILFQTVGVCQTEKFDILIKNTTIVDGTGKSSYVGNVAIKGENIVGIGDITGEAEIIIDGKGLITSPGFIDPHSHADMNLTDLPVAENLIMQGITTILAGHCGISPAPAKDLSFGDWLSIVNDKGISVNYAPVIGHNTIRSLVMGEDFKRNAGADEIVKMQKYIEDAMKSGAFGLSSMLDYCVGEYASTEELIELAKIAGKYGGRYFTHTRHTQSHWSADSLEEFDYSVYHGPVEDVIVGIYRGVEEVFEISRKSGTPGHIAHMNNIFLTTLPHSDEFEKATALETLRTIDRVRKKGLDITFDVIASASSIMSMSSIIRERVFRQVLGEYTEEQLPAKLNSPVFKEQVWAVHDANRLKFGMIHTKVDPYWFNCFQVLECTNKAYEGKTIGEIAKLMDVDPLDAVCDVVIEDPDAKWMQSVDRRGTDISIAVLLTHPDAMPSTDIGLAELEEPEAEYEDNFRNIGQTPPIVFGLYPNYINVYVNDMKVLSIEEAIYKATLRVAQVNGIKNRGLLKQGAFADIVIFEQDKMRMTGDFTKRAGAPEGIEYVIVNGELIYKNMKHTGIRSGKVLQLNQ